MGGQKVGDVDIVKELRLRRWARENYVPADHRKNSWHPIVLDEMSARDSEYSDRCRVRFPYVPLAPSSLHIQGGYAADTYALARVNEAEVFFHG